MINRKKVLLILFISTFLTGILYFVSAPPLFSKKYLFDGSIWTKQNEKRIASVFSVYGIEKSWIKEDSKTEKLVPRPIFTVQTPPDIPFSDLNIKLNSEFKDADFHFLGFDHRRERLISFHAYDGNSVIATYNLKISDKFKRNRLRIYLLIDDWKTEESDGYNAIMNREITATPMISLKEISDAQSLVTNLNKAKVDFGMKILTSGSSLSLSEKSPAKVLEGTRNKIQSVFPFASFYLLPSNAITFKDSKTKTINKFMKPSLLGSSQAISSISALQTSIKSVQKDSDYLILKTNFSLLENDDFISFIVDLQRKGYSFRYFRDFASDKKNSEN